MVGQSAESGRVGAPRSGPESRAPDRRTVPHGFDDFRSFQEFAGGFRDRMRERYPDLEMGFQGSAVTGRSAETGARFDVDRQSDFDVAIAGESVYAAAREHGVPFRGDGVSTGPLTAVDVRMLGLADIVRDASARAGGRPINLMSRPGWPKSWASPGKNATATTAAVIFRRPSHRAAAVCSCRPTTCGTRRATISNSPTSRTIAISCSSTNRCGPTM
jgi:filamentous hemagglutinin